jgi:hypothetical protein
MEFSLCQNSISYPHDGTAPAATLLPPEQCLLDSPSSVDIGAQGSYPPATAEPKPQLEIDLSLTVGFDNDTSLLLQRGEFGRTESEFGKKRAVLLGFAREAGLAFLFGVPVCNSLVRDWI